ncbi:MAG: hypothetical protein H0X25_22185 [Acidobacteriales bacterium]|nr:hypothetical protein [Terriglobales bacterium]
MSEIWINLGWECNINHSKGEVPYFTWGVGTLQEAVDYVAYFQKIVACMKSAKTQSVFKFTWNVNGGPPYVSKIIEACYPGDDVVDAVGMEMYDGWGGNEMPPGGRNPDGTFVDPAAVWQTNYDLGYGRMRDFCVQHRKAYAVPEWGLSPAPSQSTAIGAGGDNPTFIQKFAQYVNSFPRVAYVNYFNIAASDTNHLLDTFPNSKAAFRSYW